VIDAEPARDYAECLLKASFLTAFDPGFELLETLRLEDGEYPLLSLHLERLQDSARHLGFRCSLAAVSSVLAEEAAARQAGLHRVRLTLAHDGRCAAQVSPLANHPASTGCVVLAAERLPADDYLRAYKTTARATTARARYDRALAAVAARPEVFDVIFLNSRGEVCEGARSNVFVERDGVLLTPPAACGLLPGVMRRRLLESGRAVEKILCREDLRQCEDLRQAPALYVGNALRGLMPVRLVQ